MVRGGGYVEIKYVRCSECGYIYQESFGKCPQCGAQQPITEDVNNTEPVFNILD